jgi:hypothetical protein
MMLCSQGVRHDPFQLDVSVGAVQRDGELLLSVQSDTPYRGTLRFDGPRTEFGGVEIDWARINEMPQWYVVRPEKAYVVTVGAGADQILRGRELIDGFPVDVVPGKPLRICVRRDVASILDR